MRRLPVGLLVIGLILGCGGTNTRKVDDPGVADDVVADASTRDTSGADRSFRIDVADEAGMSGPDPVSGVDARPVAVDAAAPVDAATVVVTDGGNPSVGNDAAPAAAVNSLVYVAGRAGIEVFELDGTTGTLKSRGQLMGDGPYYLASDPKHRYLYGVGFDPSRIIAFAINETTGLLTKINQALTAPGAQPAFLSVHGSGRWVWVAHYGSGHVTVHAVAANGSITAPVASYQAGQHAHSVLPDPMGRFVFVPCVGSNHVAQYSFDADKGRLTPNDPPTVPSPAGVGPRHIAFHPSKNFAYVMNESMGAMTAYKYDPATGRLMTIETVPTVPAGATEKQGAHVEVHPSGKFVYGTNRQQRSVVIFSIDQTTGRLSLVGHETAGGLITYPEFFALDPSGRYLLLTSSDAVLVFQIDDASGRLTLKTKKASLPSAHAVAVMPAL